MAITPAQVRGARAMLNITQDELAVMSELKRVAIARFETGMTAPHASTLEGIQAALEAAGAVFIETNAGVGVMLRHEANR
jgi:predicted transcriptional regulator